MSNLKFKNEATSLIFIGGLVDGLRIVSHISNGVFEFSSLNATIFNIKNQKDHGFHLKIDLSSTLNATLCGKSIVSHLK